MTDLFIRKKHEISEENLDKKRIDDYVDDGWDRAADQMEENKEPVDRYVKLVGGRRGNIVNAMKRALVCICEWLDVVKKSTNSENEYANRLYLEGKDAIYSNLETLAEDFASVPGCGAASIVYTAKELCARLDGSYCPQNRKYFYQPFRQGAESVISLTSPLLCAAFGKQVHLLYGGVTVSTGTMKHDKRAEIVASL